MHQEYQIVVFLMHIKLQNILFNSGIAIEVKGRVLGLYGGESWANSRCVLCGR